MSGSIDNQAPFIPLRVSEVERPAMGLSDYGLDNRDDRRAGNLVARALFDSEWVNRTGHENATPQRVQLVYLHIFGPSGQTVRDEILGVDRSQAHDLLREHDWPDDDLEAVIAAAMAEKGQRRALLDEALPAGRIPLFRGVHCMTPTGGTAGPTPLQEWVAAVVSTGIDDGTLHLDNETGEPTGHVHNVEPCTATVDSWTPSYEGAKFWSRTRLPGNEMCMVMAANVTHSHVVFWRRDSGACDEVLVLGGPGAVNVYFQEQFVEKATPEEIASW